MRVFQGKKALAVGILLAVILLSGIWCSSQFIENSFSMEQSDAACAHRQELSSGDELTLVQAAVTGSLRVSVWQNAMQSLTGREDDLERQANRLYFISLFAILFKIAVIPSIVLMVAVTTERSTSGALCRTMRFLHDSDGKKERRFLYL